MAACTDTLAVVDLPVQREASPTEDGEHLQDEDLRPWDINDESAVEDDDRKENTFFQKAMKVFKAVVYLSTFCIILACGVASKGTMLFMTSVIAREAQFPACDDKIGLEKDEKYVVKISDGERRSWIWCLLFILIIPEILIFLRSSKNCIFKKFGKPKISSFLTVFISESLHVIGLTVMVFVVLPQLHVLQALCLTSGVCVIPGLLNLLSNWSSEWDTKSGLRKILDLAAVIGQVSVFMWAAMNSNKKELWLASACLVLISCAWWENFINENTSNCLSKVKEDIEDSRYFIYIFISLWKIIFTFSLALICLFFLNENVENFLGKFLDSFKSHNVSVHWTPVTDYTIPDRVTPPPQVLVPSLKSDPRFPAIIVAIHVLTSYLCYSCGKFVCKIRIQEFSYAFPLCLTVPLTFSLLSTACIAKTNSSCAYSKITPYLFWSCPKESLTHYFTEEAGYLWIFWLLSQVWITIHIWTPRCERMAPTNELFVNPMYCTAVIDQSLALNRRKYEKIEQKQEAPRAVTRIFACATMWHETPEEMELLLKSIMRLDAHQCCQKTVQEGLSIKNPDYYELEAHIFFDDAFVVSDEDDTKFTINNFVKDLIEAVDTAASKIYKKCTKPDPPLKVPTPYGGRLMWRLLGDNFLVVHLKNKDLIRHKKRWSQVMYMYYLLGYHLESIQHIEDIESIRKNTFILALDGDIDFRPNAVQLLVDLMNKNPNLGAACGRIHPVGTGMMVYYQKFEYAIGHWLQKATEHMIGCVLCSPGCFSLFRAEALIKKNTIRRYATKSREAIEYVQFDQGEDRWLCTLLLQRGYRVEYSAASDAYTHCPETFAEFYTQRRRWAPSTMANIMDLLINYKKTVKCNDNISRPYIGYQVLLMVGTILGPGTIFLMLVGAMVSAFGISNWHSLIANFIPIILFIVICFYAKNDTQIMMAQIFSALYALLMMAVLVGVALQIVMDGITSPSAIFILSMTGTFLIAALVHPQEFWCVAHGLLYFLSVPSMYLLLALYSIINLHVVSWGTREVQTKKTKKQLENERLQAQVLLAQPSKKKGGLFDWLNNFGSKGQEEEEGSISFGFANLFRCMCCTYPKPDPSNLHMVKIEAHLEKMNDSIRHLQRQIDSSVVRVPGFRRRSSIHGIKQDLDAVQEDESDEEDEAELQEQETDVPEEHTYNQPDNNEYWLYDKALKKSPVKRLSDEEMQFWSELINTYLYPLADDPEEKAKVCKQLIDLRNKVVFGILMLNSLYILIVFLLQMQKEILHIKWPLTTSGKANITYIPAFQEIRIDEEYLQLEPINLVFVFFFTLILIIQFIGMLFHRLETMSHILASTNLLDLPSGDVEEITLSEITDLLKKQGLKDDEIVENVLDAAPDRRRRFTSHYLDVPQREKLRFRSLSFALEHDLQKILDKDPKFTNKVRRLSKNPEALEALKRRTSCHQLNFPSRMGTPQLSMRQQEDILDRAFGTPSSSLRSSYINPAFEDISDSESVHSIQKIVPSSRSPIFKTKTGNNDLPSTPNLSSLKRKLNKVKTIQEEQNK
ncbi:hypothetical protein X975_24033, partial [Stegodyphus mimosarum]